MSHSISSGFTAGLHDLPGADSPLGLKGARVLFDKDDTPAPTVSGPSATEIADRVTRAMQQGGGSQSNQGVEMALQLLKDRATQLEQANVQLQKEKNDLAGKLPEGAVVLTGEEAKAYKTIHDALPEGDRSQAVQKVLKRLGKADEDAKFRREQEAKTTYLQAAKAIGVNGDALFELVPGLDLSLDAVNENGQTVQKPFVTVDENGTKSKVDLKTFLAQKKPLVIPALLANTGGSNGADNGGTNGANNGASNGASNGGANGANQADPFAQFQQNGNGHQQTQPNQPNPWQAQSSAGGGFNQNGGGGQNGFDVESFIQQSNQARGAVSAPADNASGQKTATA